MEAVHASSEGTFMSPIFENSDAPIRDEGPHLATSEIRFKRILVGIDFSKPATQALKTAIAICQLFGSQIFLVHAASPFVYVNGKETLPLEAFNVNLDDAREEMNQIISSEPGLSALKTKTVIAYADAVEFIGQVASEEKVDLIVVGSHGGSGLELLALGSIAEAVLRQATCPVLIVGPKCKAEQHLFRSIVFATDLETTGLRGAQYAAALAEQGRGKLTFLHVTNKRLNDQGLHPELIENQLERELRQLLPPDVERYCKSKVSLQYGQPAEAIVAVARSEDASLLIVGLQSRSPLADHSPWSTLSLVIREVKCAVLGVRSHLT
jgi:nucleotide-binding universal stress UspA family protein